MSLPRDCFACSAGDHANHNATEGITPGLIGGTRCECKGDCAERFAAIPFPVTSSHPARDRADETDYIVRCADGREHGVSTGLTRRTAASVIAHLDGAPHVRDCGPHRAVRREQRDV